MSAERGLIDEYLTALRASLWVAPDQAELIVAEAEDHLLQTAADGLAAGMTERQALEAAISAFGSVRAVVRAHESTPGHLLKGRTPAAVLGDLFLSAWKLAALGLLAAVAHTCSVAQMLEASSDGMILRAFAGVLGAAVIVGYAIVRSRLRRRGFGPAVLLAGYFPILAAGVFSAGALALVFSQLTGFQVTEGPGAFLSGALAAAAMAVCYASRARPAVRHLVRTWARRVRSR